MTRSTTSVVLALAIGLAAGAAQAGDWNNGAGGLKDAGGLAGVPVPAPVPVAESFGWYVRTDAGYAVKSSGSSTTSTALGASITRDYDGNEGPFHGSFGIGRYITPSLRWDITGDYRGLQKAQSGVTNYTAKTITMGAMVTDPATGNQVQSHQINNYDVTRSEEVRLANHTALFNMYYDFNRGGGLNPYIGAGAGLAIREGRVQYNQHAVCSFTMNDLGVPPFAQGCMEPTLDKSGKPTNVNYGLAAALMAGATYEVAQGVLIDAGYRLSWQGGNTSIRTDGGDVITAGARTDHEFRAGVRWNIW